LSSFYAAWNDGDSSKNVMLNNNLHRFLLGMFLCAINPVQIPFWFGWSTVLFSKNILQPINSHYNTYIVGIGIGTLLGNAVFIFGGKWLISRISNANEYINWIIGLVFLITAILQLIKNLKKKERIVG
jgi:threonine/homoserine/homoserine lactone efflux protein